jgi:hypothetical protein
LCTFANEVLKLQEPIRDSRSPLEWDHDYTKALIEYRRKKEKLSHLIYIGEVVCKENENEELEFIQPSEDLRPLDQEEIKEFEDNPLKTRELNETEEARYIRLKWSLRFAIESHDHSSAMRILMETTVGKDKFGEVIKASQAAAAPTVKSTTDFVLTFMKFNYKPRVRKEDDAALPKEIAKPDIEGL